MFRRHIIDMIPTFSPLLKLFFNDFELYKSSRKIKKPQFPEKLETAANHSLLLPNYFMRSLYIRGL
jgi:hypothetical protein